jgi:DNA-binding winged-HTH domains
MSIEQYLYFFDIKVSLLELKVWQGEKQIHMTLAELRLLLAFLEYPYKVISREELIRRADVTSLSALYGLINRLRVLLGHQYVFTRGGLGYSFTQTGRLRQSPKEELHERTTV